MRKRQVLPTRQVLRTWQVLRTRKVQGIRVRSAFVALLVTCLVTVVSGPLVAEAKALTYQVVTNEISAKQVDGRTVEVYRFDPAVYVATEGDDVTLKIRGVKGHDHPIELEGYHLKGVVHRNEVTTLQFHATKPGFYRLICTAHADVDHNGPMEAYVVVVPRAAAKAATERAAAQAATAQSKS